MKIIQRKKEREKREMKSEGWTTKKWSNHERKKEGDSGMIEELYQRKTVNYKRKKWKLKKKINRNTEEIQ